jgi:peptidoglycan/LPS O-acetylase OafA/YrhL
MEEHVDHGHSVAAWTAVTICIIAAAVMSVAVVFPNMPLFIGGAVLAVVGAIAGKVLSMAGYGAASRDRENAPSVR